MSDKATPRPWRLEWEGHAGQTIGAQLFKGDSRAPAVYVASSAQDAQDVLAALNSYEAHQRAAEALRELVEDAERAANPASRLFNYEEARAALAELDRVQR